MAQWGVFLKPRSVTLPVSPVAVVIVLGVDTGSGILRGDNGGVVPFTPDGGLLFKKKKKTTLVT